MAGEALAWLNQHHPQLDECMLYVEWTFIHQQSKGMIPRAVDLIFTTVQTLQR